MKKSNGDEEHDADSLDIKPPQAIVRENVTSRRKDKSSKDKKHSKERKHKERGSDREYDRETNNRGGALGNGPERDRRKDIHRRDDRRRDDHNNIDKYHARGAYEREETREVISGNERRYQKHYERMSETEGGRNYYYHHHQQQQQSYHHQTQQMHLQRRQDYYERSQNYHHASSAGEYNSNRHQQYAKMSGGHIEYSHREMHVDVQRERRKHNFETQKDAESLEQDLRSRLLSKRHKYVKSGEVEEQFEAHDEPREVQQYEERERALSKSERHRIRSEKSEKSDKSEKVGKEKEVIELLDSPEDAAAVRHHKRKHKHRSKNKEVESKKPKTPEDPEQAARREKFLVAQREKDKLKELAQKQLEARRELRRERVDKNDALSPSAVAASVTAGLHVVKRKSKTDEKVEEVVKRKRRKHARSDDNDKGRGSESDEDDEEEEDDDEDDDDDSESESESGSGSEDSAAESEKSYKKSKTQPKKRGRERENEMDSDIEIHTSDSPLSIGGLTKSPEHKSKKKTQKKRRHSFDEFREKKSRSRSFSNESDSSRSRSTHSPSSRSRSRSTDRSGSKIRSRSQSLSFRSRSRSRSRSPRSRTRSQTPEKEQDFKPPLESKDEKKPLRDEDDAPACDENGVPLPNYYPGVQGCRSVEEFQCLNRIEEGTYGVVYRAKDKRTNEIVALKRLKMEKEKEGFPITSLREINTLLKGQHPNIVTVREIVVGSNMDKIFIVMDYVEHDLKSLMETMKHKKQAFFPGEVKCLLQQLLRAVGHLHDNWILHRDLKTSNLLLSHKGILKVGDFGLAREYGSPLKKYTSLVVTLWYRAPELLLCSPIYSTPIDIWSVGCIFGEFLQMAPLFPGKSEVDQLNKIFKVLGTPNEKIWPGYKELPAVKNMLSQNSAFADYPISSLRKHFSDKATDVGITLLQGLLTFDPKQRLTAESALKHPYFKELPLPIDPAMFPTWPAKSELGARKAMASSPKPPSGGSQFKQLGRDDIVASTSGNKMLSGIITGNKKSSGSTGFVLNAGIEQRQLAMGPGFNLKF